MPYPFLSKQGNKKDTEKAIVLNSTQKPPQNNKKTPKQNTKTSPVLTFSSLKSKMATPVVSLPVPDVVGT